MPIRRLKEFLDNNRVKYSIITHPMAFTAHEIAAAAHISGYELAKAVILKADGKLVMAVIPASYKINVGVLSELVGTCNVSLADEHEFQYRFPDCEVGAMPPFGNLWHMEVYASERLSYNEHIVFNAGSHTELIRMTYIDYESLVKPRVINYYVTN